MNHEIIKCRTENNVISRTKKNLTKKCICSRLKRRYKPAEWRRRSCGRYWSSRTTSWTLRQEQIEKLYIEINKCLAFFDVVWGGWTERKNERCNLGHGHTVSRYYRLIIKQQSLKHQMFEACKYVNLTCAEWVKTHKSGPLGPKKVQRGLTPSHI